jgi:hypothetical protein
MPNENEERGEWIALLKKETGLEQSELAELDNRLHDLAAHHFLLALGRVNGTLDLSDQQYIDVSNAIKSKIDDLLADVPGIKSVRFLDDPRGETVAVMFDSGAFNSFTEGWKVPLDPQRLSEINKAPFLSVYQTKTAGDDESTGPR